MPSIPKVLGFLRSLEYNMHRDIYAKALILDLEMILDRYI